MSVGRHSMMVGPQSFGIQYAYGTAEVHVLNYEWCYLVV